MIDVRAKPPAPEPIEAAIAVARQPVEAVGVPEKLHPLVAKTLVAARKAQPDRNGAITGLGGEVFLIRAHPDTLDRVGAFLNALVYNALARGHRFEAGRESLEMVVDDEAIGSSAYQTIRRSLHVATEEETRRRERWDARHRNDWDNWDKRPSIPYYDFTPTSAGSMTYSWGWASPRDRNSSIDFHIFLISRIVFRMIESKFREVLHNGTGTRSRTRFSWLKGNRIAFQAPLSSFMT